MTAPETAQAAAEHYDVAVIGAGPAGTAAALRAAELGACVVVLEAARVGGTCVNTGCVPTRVLAKTARLIREARSAGDYGIASARPTSTGRRRSRACTSGSMRCARSSARRSGSRRRGSTLVHEGRARFVDDRTLVLDSGRRVTARLDPHLRRRALAAPADPRGRARDGSGGRARPPGAAAPRRGHRGGQHRRAARDGLQRVRLGGDAARRRAARAHGLGRRHLRGGRRRVRRAGRRRAHRHRAASNASRAGRRGDRPSPGCEDGDPVGRLRRGHHGDRLARRRRGPRTRERRHRRSCAPPSRSTSTSAPPCRTSSPSATRTGATCSCRRRSSRARRPPRTRCSARTAARRSTCCPRAASPTPTTRASGSPRSRRASATRSASSRPCRYADLDRAVIDDRETGFLTLIADRRRELILGAHAVGRERDRGDPVGDHRDGRRHRRGDARATCGSRTRPTAR